MTQTMRTGLRQHCLQAHERHAAAEREREERNAREAVEARNRFVAHELAQWLPSEPKIDALPFEIDGLAFDVRYHSWGGGCGSERRLVLLWECAECHERTAEVWVSTDYQLGAFLADPKPDPCPGCKAEAEERRRQQAPPPTPPPSAEERLTAALRDLMEARLEERDEAESTREYYRAEREERRARDHAADLRQLRSEHESETYRLASEINDLKRRTERRW